MNLDDIIEEELEKEKEQMKKLRDWWWPLFHPVFNIIDEDGKIGGVDIEDVHLDFESVDP